MYQKLQVTGTKIGPTSSYTFEEVLGAIKNSGGVKSLIVARLGGMARVTLNSYITKHEVIAAAYHAEQKRVVDCAETRLMQIIQSEPDDIREKELQLRAIQFFLSKKARDRGYGDKVEHTHEVKQVIHFDPDDALE